MRTSKSTDMYYHVTVRVFLSNLPFINFGNSLHLFWLLQAWKLKKAKLKHNLFLDIVKRGMGRFLIWRHKLFGMHVSGPLPWLLRWAAAVIAICRNVGGLGTNCWFSMKWAAGNSVMSLMHDSCFFGKKENIVFSFLIILSRQAASF